MSQDEFTKLFKYVTERFDRIDQRFAEVDKQFDDVRGPLDAFLAKADVDDTERLVLGHQVDRHAEWIERAAKQLSVSYDSAR